MLLNLYCFLSTFGNKLKADRKGVAAMEYALMAALIGGVIIATVKDPRHHNHRHVRHHHRRNLRTASWRGALLARACPASCRVSPAGRPGWPRLSSTEGTGIQ